jgi:hypothetical protein
MSHYYFCLAQNFGHIMHQGQKSLSYPYLTPLVLKNELDYHIRKNKLDEVLNREEKLFQCQIRNHIFK